MRVSLCVGLLAMLLCSIVVEAAEIPLQSVRPTHKRLVARHSAGSQSGSPASDVAARVVSRPVISRHKTSNTPARLQITSDMPAGVMLTRSNVLSALAIACKARGVHINLTCIYQTH